MSVMFGLVILTFITSAMELFASQYAFSLMLAADSLHMFLDAIVYISNLIAEHMDQKLNRAKEEMQFYVDERAHARGHPTYEREEVDEMDDVVIGDDDNSDEFHERHRFIISKPFANSNKATEEITRIDLEDDEDFLSPRILEAEAKSASLAISANKWQVASSMLTGLVLAGSAVSVLTVSVVRFVQAVESKNDAAVDKEMDTNMIFVSGVVGVSLHICALLAFVFLPELHNFHHKPSLLHSLGSPRCKMQREGDYTYGCYTHGQDLHISATLFHIIADGLSNVGLLVVLILVKLDFHPVIVDSASAIVISSAVLVMAFCLLRVTLPAFKVTFWNPTLVDAIPVDCNASYSLSGTVYQKRA
eukprot:CAMPEP_0184505256 /NCGR_PEP_ID=MMETSP0113_2-20130426/52894_1 /TAXON_ID=91329 /ORGANISM="Norrisiella sphaerica, Strain BC52" /LENGTH=360 /DNA_ID=CAMNT_0026894941 /DNA_START=105 /DNA_END=1187 /DNA_ORIENTATION=-